jgi:hypothetical protein
MNDKPKKPYAKPEVTEVPLRPEEAVLGNCKTSSTNGPTPGHLCNYLGMCNTIGS